MSALVKRKCVVCRERYQRGGSREKVSFVDLCEQCVDSMHGRPIKETALAWAARRARSFELARQRDPFKRRK